jgi:hypothetical protein
MAASDLTLAAFCVLASASYLGLEIYAGLRPAQSQAFLVRFRTWMDIHTDQVIIAREPAPRPPAHREKHPPDPHLKSAPW